MESYDGIVQGQFGVSIFETPVETSPVDRITPDEFSLHPMVVVLHFMLSLT